MIAGCFENRPENPKRSVHPEAMGSLEASRAAKRRRLALAGGVKGQMELDALWSQLKSDLGEMEHRISALASSSGPNAMQEVTMWQSKAAFLV